MSEKRRGLGRGLGALIPSGPIKPSGDRPVDDVFFGGSTEASDPGAQQASGTTTATLERPAVSPSVALSTSVDTEPAGQVERAPKDATDRPEEPSEASSSAPAGRGKPAPVSAVDGAARAFEDQTPDDDGGLVPVPGARFAEIPVEAIRPNPRQPRQVFDEEDLVELVHSIREIGVLQPIVVRQIADIDGSPAFELVMGERRWRATQEAGLATVPAIIRDTADDDLLRDALLENLHRSQLNALEEAAAYQQLLDDFGCTHEELASRIGRSRPQISNTIRLLRLPPLVQRRVAAGVLSAGHARALLGLEDSVSMEALAQRIVAEGMSVRAVEEVVSLGDAPASGTATKKRPRPGTHRSELDELAARLGDKLDTKVGISLGQRKGRLTIEFASVEDLNRIVASMDAQIRGVFTESS